MISFTLQFKKKIPKALKTTASGVSKELEVN